VVTGDFNGDGKMDVAIADRAANTITVLLGKDHNTFQAAVRFATGTTPGSLVTATSTVTDTSTSQCQHNSNDVTVLLGQGDGTFQAQAPVQRRGLPVGSRGE